MANETLRATYRRLNGECEWIEVIGKHGEWDKFFRYFEGTLKDDPTKSTFFERTAREGYEYLENNHGQIEEIKREVAARQRE